MSETANRQGGANSWKQGILKRPLPPVTIFNFGNLAGTGLIDEESTIKLRLHGINVNLPLIISAGIVSAASNAPIDYPPLPGTLKVTPFQHTANGDILYLKTLTLAPQVLPASYVMGAGFRQGATEDNPDYGVALADGAILEITVDPTQYDETGVTGNLIVAITATYDGDWWDVEAITKLIGELRIDSCQPLLVNTGGA